MATAHREPNRARWVGVRPGHEGDQVYADDSVSNATKVLYTVPAGKILLITGGWLQSVASAAASGYFTIRAGGGGVLYHFMRHAFLVAGNRSDSWNLSIPFECAAAETVEIISSAAVLSCYGGFHGLLIPA